MHSSKLLSGSHALMQVLTTRQCAMYKVFAYPQFFDVVAAMNAVAESVGEQCVIDVAAQAVAHASRATHAELLGRVEQHRFAAHAFHGKYSKSCLIHSAKCVGAPTVGTCWIMLVCLSRCLSSVGKWHGLLGCHAYIADL